jgi:hypothetical protein
MLYFWCHCVSQFVLKPGALEWEVNKSKYHNCVVQQARVMNPLPVLGEQRIFSTMICYHDITSPNVKRRNFLLFHWYILSNGSTANLFHFLQFINLIHRRLDSLHGRSTLSKSATYILDNTNRINTKWSEFLATDPEVRVRFSALPEFLWSSGSGTGFT